jgi:hypothetical protein
MLLNPSFSSVLVVDWLTGWDQRFQELDFLNGEHSQPIKWRRPPILGDIINTNRVHLDVSMV